MSKFLIIPKSVYGQFACCGVNGYSSAVLSPSAEGNSFGTNFTPIPADDGQLDMWLISDGLGKRGGVGFSVCCGIKQFTVYYTCVADFTYISTNAANVIFRVFHAGQSITVWIIIQRDGESWVVNVLENFATVKTYRVDNLGRESYEFSRMSAVQATPCSGAIYFEAECYVSPGPSSPTNVGAEVYADIVVQ